MTATAPVFYRTRPEFNPTWAPFWTITGATEAARESGWTSTGERPEPTTSTPWVALGITLQQVTR